MDDIFGKKAWCIPMATKSSTGLSTTLNEESSNTETDSGCSYGSKFLHEPFFHSLWIYLVLILLFSYRIINIKRETYRHLIAGKKVASERRTRTPSE